MKPKLMITLSVAFLSIFMHNCESLVNRFEATEKAQCYRANHVVSFPTIIDTIKVMTWNIRFGARRILWFGDSCGDRVILTKEEVLAGLEGIARKIYEEKPDIVFLQEVDVDCKRTAYIDQVQWLLDNTDLNYGAYASMWQAQVVPSDGLGRLNTGQAIISRWKIQSAERIQLALRSDQDALTRYFYLRRNLLKTRIAIPNVENFYALNIHAEAFSTDDTKQKHIQRCLEELQRLDEDGAYFILGGDFNLLPPGSDSTDYCDEDACSGEHFHKAKDNPQHKEGSNYTPEITWMQPLYDQFKSAVPLSDYLANQSLYFTHTTNHPDGFWNRKLDYLFTNTEFVSGSDSTHQEAMMESDHCPVTAKWRIPR